MVKIKLGDVIDFKNGKSIKKSDGVIPIYGGNGILGYTDKSNFSHTIVVGRVGAYCGSIYVEENSCWVSDNAIAGVPKEGQDLTYLYYVLKSLNLNSKQIGSSQPLITQSMLRDMVVDIEINIEEQKRIANSISIIDQKIQINNQINQELEDMAKTLYDYWFVQFDFPDQNGKPYKSSGGKMVYHPELKREIPEGWGVEKLENLGTIVGGSTPTKSISDNFTKGGEGYSWITPNDLSNNKGNKFIKNGEIDVTVRGLKDAGLKLYPEGTVLMSSRAPVGYLAISTKEITTNQGFKSFIPDKKYGKNYIYYTLQNNLKVIEQHASGSTFKEISATVLKDITIIQPNLDIVKKFEEKVSSINSYIKVNEEQKQELTQVRDWLLPMLMNGQVKVE